MLLQSVREPFDRPEYVHEAKRDGCRLLVFVGETIRLQTRHLRFVQNQFPEIVEACSILPPGTVLDGELVVFEHGRPSFPAIRRRIATTTPHRVAALAAKHPATFLGFDLLYYRDAPMIDLPLEQRRHQLLTLPSCDRISYPEHFDSGTALYEAVMEQGLEGIVAKRRDSLYHPGKRSRAWLKCKPPGYDAERFRKSKRYA